MNKLLVAEQFGRLLKRGVAYGAMFPGYVNTMHQANEFTEVEDLYRAAAIYAEAIYELIKSKKRDSFVSFLRRKIWKHLKN